MALLIEIKNSFATLTDGMSLPLKLPAKYPAWVIHSDGRLGVAIPCRREEEFYEHFAKIQLQYFPQVMVGGKQLSLLYLFIERKMEDRDTYLYEFATLCNDFVQPGEGGRNRQMLQKHPEDWWQNWKNLVGNRNTEQQIHSVAGELFFYRWLLKQGQKVSWTGGQYKRIDFSSDKEDYEVKSTLQRYSMIVTIHGEYQLKSTPRKKLWLVLCRLEETDGGESVNNLVDDLCQLGLSRKYLEKELELLGLKQGMSARKREWHLLELRRYLVDRNFPRITADDFRDGRFPEGVTRLQYDVDLANLSGEIL